MGFLWKQLVLPIAANALALFVTQYFLHDSGFEITRGVFGFLMVGIALGVLNTVVRPILKLVSLPLMIPSLGLIFVAINALILSFTEYIFNTMFSETFAIHFSVGNGLLSYLLAGIILGIVNMLTHVVLRV